MEQGKVDANREGTELRGVIFPGAVHALFSASLLDESFCMKLFIEMTHGPDPVCPGCGEKLVGQVVEAYYNFKRFLCNKCKNQHKATKGTVLHGSSLSASQYFLLALLVAMDRPASEVSKMVGISSKSVRDWKVKLDG